MDSGVLDTNMEAIGRKMVKLCAGLPLAIIVLGGLLATKHTLWEWDAVYQNVRLHKWSDDPIQHDNGVSTVLALSYHDLPYQLKPCFLYFDDDRVGDEIIMDVTKRYLDALAQRCMVQVEVDEFNGRIDYCRIHDLMDCEVIVIHGMEQLRHLYNQCNLNVKLKFDGLSNLETLEGFDTGSCDVNDLCKLINLRQLEDATFWKKHNQDLAAFINYLSIGAPHLRQTTLSVEFCKKEEEELTLLKQLLGCHHLYRLSINGIIPELPEYCQGFFPNLIKLTLSGCELEEDPMPTLERLPNIQYLRLSAGAFEGDKMVCSANGFPQLKTLYLSFLMHLKEWEVEKGAMPNLSALEIEFCRGLEMVPEGLRFIATLQQFTIKNACENFNNKLRRVNGEEGEDFYKVRHVSSLKIFTKCDMCLPSTFVQIGKHQKKNGKWKKKILEG
ncbi:unnamed protein product [Camellia sinensis]